MVLHINQEHLHKDDEQPVPSETGVKKVDYDRLLTLGRALLIAIGEDPDREGLVDTPRRWANWWREFIEYEPGTLDTTFHDISTHQLVCVSGIRIFSLCEHHLLPMWCDIAIGYIPTENVLGLSKFARIAHKYAHQLQVQERIGPQIADEITHITQTQTIAIMIQGSHLCLSARGIRTPGCMTTFTWRGDFERDEVLRREFLQVTRETGHN